MAHRCICAWCKKLIREGDEPITHGMCEDCMRRELERANDGQQSRSSKA